MRREFQKVVSIFSPIFKNVLGIIIFLGGFSRFVLGSFVWVQPVPVKKKLYHVVYHLGRFCCNTFPFSAVLCGIFSHVPEKKERREGKSVSPRKMRVIPGINPFFYDKSR